MSFVCLWWTHCRLRTKTIQDSWRPRYLSALLYLLQERSHRILENYAVCNAVTLYIYTYTICGVRGLKLWRCVQLRDTRFVCFVFLKWFAVSASQSESSTSLKTCTSQYAVFAPTGFHWIPVLKSNTQVHTVSEVRSPECSDSVWDFRRLRHTFSRRSPRKTQINPIDSDSRHWIWF